MSMLVPRSNRIFNDLMTDPFDNFFGTMAAPSVKTAPNLMRTDIRETDTGFELTIDLPGFDKEGVQAELKDPLLLSFESPFAVRPRRGFSRVA